MKMIVDFIKKKMIAILQFLCKKFVDAQKEKEIEELKAQNADLEKALQIKGNLTLKDQAYFLNENKEIKDGPFCTRCFEIIHRTCHLWATDKEPNVYCPNCKSEVASKPLFDYLRPEVESERQRRINTQQEDCISDYKVI